MVHIAYILGTTRSGTSAIRNALARTRYKGYGEGHLINILNGVLQTVRHNSIEHSGLALGGNGMSALKPNVLLRHFFHAYERYLSEEIGSRFLLDKTPNILPIISAPDLAAFHQNAKFIYCSRRHVDNLQSKRQKFSDQSFTNQCNEWAECSRTWERVRPQLGDYYTAFDYIDLISNREATCKKIGSLLGLDEDEIGKMVSYLTSERPQTSNRDRELDRFIRFADVDWPENDKEVFLRICAPIGETLGYGLETYYASDGIRELR